MQPLAVGAKLAAYQAHLQDSHDFTVTAQVLTTDERPVGRLDLLDGQVDLDPTSAVKRTATLTISDPDGALLLGDSAAWSGTSLWADRLVRITHTVDVPGYGEVTAIPFVGVPTSLSRQGPEVQVELMDKTALGLYGSKPFTVRKGQNALVAIRQIMASCTGEFRFRLPTTARRLSRSYSVGWTDEAAPFRVAARIARNELNADLFYTGDGYLACRQAPSRLVTRFDYPLDLPSAGVDFTTAKNAAYVKGKKVVGFKSAPASHPLSPTRLGRRGVPRWLPVVVSDDSVKKKAGAERLAARTMTANLALEQDAGVAVIPMFHHDFNDVVSVAGHRLRMRTASIPLGVGGPMVIGVRRWVSRPVRVHGS